MWNPLEGLSSVNVGFRKLKPWAVMPYYASEEASGADLCAISNDILMPGSQLTVPIGIAIELQRGFEAQIRPRSGLAARHGVTVLNSPGTIDSDYRGELMVILANHGRQPFMVKQGERIAQLVVLPIFRANFKELVELSDTVRGVGGLGSTGL